jgi:carboxypeptidase D
VTFFTDMATNATKANLGVVIYSGNDDMLVPHWGSEGATLLSFGTFSS